MTVREYIGARYIPVFSDPIEWSSANAYEPLVVVTYQGSSYVSRQSVPPGIELTNEQYWVKWADYNAQLQAYLDRVDMFDERITGNSDAIAAFNEELAAYEEQTNAALAAETQAREQADTAETQAREQADTAETQAREQADTELKNLITQKNEKIRLFKNNYKSGNNLSQRGYLVIPRDSFRIAIQNCDGSNSNQQLSNPIEFGYNHNNAILVHNCDFFPTDGSARPMKVNGITYNWSTTTNHPLFAFNTENQTFELYPAYTNPSNIPENYDTVFAASYQLILNGAIQNVPNDTVQAPRMGFGYDNENFYIVWADGRSIRNNGVTHNELAQFALSVGITNLINFDGGGSISIYFDGEKINKTRDYALEFPNLRNVPLCFAYYQK